MEAIFRRHHGGSFPRPNAIQEMAKLAHVPIRSFAGNDASELALFTNAQRLLAPGAVVIGGGAFEVNRVAHVEAETRRHGPAALGMDNSAGGDIVLGDDVIDGSAKFHIAGRENAPRPPETELQKIRVMDVQIEKTSTRLRAINEGVEDPARPFSLP